ncbi:MAG: hypothetical protein IJP93_05275 [Bacteroidales bacterium]|nr:hypothetical protein [Bacteroidales bacterium]
MKNKYLLFSMIVLAGCTVIDPDLPMGETRGDEHPSSSSSQGGDSSGDSGSDAPARKDTTFYVSAVCFNQDYEWQRDTAFGAVACTLKVFKGAIPLHIIPAGPECRISASPHRNHLMGGSLFSEYADSKGTVIKQDGREIASWPERESLLGLLVKDGVLHTVGADYRSRGFCYRIGGKVVLKVEIGQVFGSFNKDTYGPSGALYVDRGSVCFAYSAPLNGQRTAFIVKDGTAEPVASGATTEYLDVKQIDGTVALLYNESGRSWLKYGNYMPDISCGGRRYWHDGGAIIYEGRPSVIGTYSVSYETGMGIGWVNSVRVIPGGADYVYCDGVHYAAVKLPYQGLDDCFFFNRGCACLAGGDLAVVLTPKSPYYAPAFTYRDKKIEFSMHGFLSGVSFVAEE